MEEKKECLTCANMQNMILKKKLFRCEAPASKQCDFRTIINWENYCTGLKFEDYERAAKNE